MWPKEFNQFHFILNPKVSSAEQSDPSINGIQTSLEYVIFQVISRDQLNRTETKEKITLSTTVTLFSLLEATLELWECVITSTILQRKLQR